MKRSVTFKVTVNLPKNVSGYDMSKYTRECFRHRGNRVIKEDPMSTINYKKIEIIPLNEIDFS